MVAGNLVSMRWINVPLKPSRTCAHRARIELTALSVAVLLAFGAGCGEDDLLITVNICGDVRVPQDIDAVRVGILNNDRSPATAGVLQLLECQPAERIIKLPQSMDLDSEPGQVWVVLDGIKDEIVVATYEQQANVEEGEQSTLTMGVTILYTVLVYGLNTLVDLAYTLLDPRIKLEDQ